MAKGNMLLGYSRGSVGDVVLSRVKGQQVSKARNRQPANPKTNRQMLQRSSFISPVKFYTHGTQALFRFAFSDKRAYESDFNAFMRNNSKAAFPVTKDENDNPAFPALGNYIMTKGKLAEVPFQAFDLDQGAVAVPLGVGNPIQTVAQLSAAFVAQGYAVEGDIITLVAINETVAFSSATEIALTAGETPHWTIDQFIVDSSDPTPVGTAIPHAILGDMTGDNYIAMLGADASPDTHLHSVAVVRSRETALGLEVSTSYLHNGGTIDDYIRYRNDKTQTAKVLAAWGATGEAILQGSIAKK